MIRTVFHIIFLLLSLSVLGQYQTQLVVAQDSSGDFLSIQDAIDGAKAFPDERVTIFIKNGTYREKVKVHSWNTSLSLIGEHKDSVIIVWDDHFKKINRGRNSTFHTYTLLVDADDFYAENLTIINSAGPVGQAIALSVEGDRCTFINCTIQGHQDTLFVSGANNRQYFKSCHISGTTDYIFGNATVLFENCRIHSLSDSYITAASTEASVEFGFVFKNCVLSAAEDVKRVYLGRPWRKHAKTAFLNCEMEGHIRPEGWHNWDDPDKERTVIYAEHDNHGEGSNTESRVKWSKKLSNAEASNYTPDQLFKDWDVKAVH